MERTIEKGLDLCFVFDLNPYKDDEMLRSTFVYRVNALLLFLSLLGPGYFISVYLLDGPYEETFAKRSAADPDCIPALKHRYFKSLTPLKDCSPHHSYALYEKTEQAIHEAQDRNPSVSYETHSFYVTATPVTRCCQDEHGFDVFHGDSSRHLFLLGMDEDDAFQTCEDTGCEDFFLYDLNDDGVDECFEDLFHALRAVYEKYERNTFFIDEKEERRGGYLS